MSRMWEIRENATRSRRSGRNVSDVDYDDEDDDDSYECGYDDGYRAAMQAMGRKRSRRGEAE